MTIILQKRSLIDLVRLNMNPSSNALVLSVHEKTQIKARYRTQPGLPLSAGRIGSPTHHYNLHETVSLYAVFNALTGKVTGRVADRYRLK